MQFLSEVWNAVLDELRKSYSENSMVLWFTDLRLVKLTENTAVIAVKQGFKTEILRSKYTKPLEDIFSGVLGFSVNVEFVSGENKEADMAPRVENAPAASEASGGGIPFVSDSEFFRTDFLDGINNLSDISVSGENRDGGASPGTEQPKTNLDYTFENFIVGDSNKFAHAACLAVADNFGINGSSADSAFFGKQYNPLFIHGPSGLGKTHLLYAVMNRINSICPSAKIVYVKGEDFTNQLIDALSHKTNEQFRNKYRKADVLLIDDIQFIAGKVSTQEEFFHTFNALYEKHKQIILTSDCPPRDIKTLEDRLKSRFVCGLTADIQPPNFELRIAIMKSKAEALGIDLPPDVLEFFAENLRNNVRQLEGAVKKLGAQSFLTGAKITVDLAISCVADLMTGSEPVTVTVDRILEKVSKKYGIPVEDIKGRKRTKEIARARHVSIYLIRNLTDLSLSAIGKIFSRDHTTILSSISAMEAECAGDALFEIELGELTREIRE